MSGRIGSGAADKKAALGGVASPEGLGRILTIRCERKGLRPMMTLSVPKVPRVQNRRNHPKSGQK